MKRLCPVQIAAMQFGTIQEFEKYNWDARYRDVQVIPQVEFTIRRTGTLLKSSPIPGSGGTNR